MESGFYFRNYLSPDIIDIFTDASTFKEGVFTHTCSGFLTMNMNKEINSGLIVEYDSTSNLAEIKGLKMAIREAVRLRQSGFTGIINIFSDSQLALLGIKEYIFNWSFRQSCGEYNLYTKTNNTVVTGQSDFVTMLQLIVENNLHVNLYHVTAHADFGYRKDEQAGAHGKRVNELMRRCKINFINNNLNKCISVSELSSEFILYISACNNQIDDRTRWFLKHCIDLDKLQYGPAFTVNPTSDFKSYINKYRQIKHDTRQEELKCLNNIR